MSNADHAATLTELLGLVDERYQAALHAGIARLSPAGLTPSPRQRAEALVASGPMAVNSEWWVNAITTAIQVAISDQTAALQSALEDLARVKQERDGLAQRLRYECPDCCGTGAVETSGPDDGQVELMACARCGPAYDELAAHDREVAARVLRHAESLVPGPLLLTLAYEYEDGEREVPGE